MLFESNGLRHKPTSADETAFISFSTLLKADDHVALLAAGSGSTWGTTGYNGSWFEVEEIPTKTPA